MREEDLPKITTDEWLQEMERLAPGVTGEISGMQGTKRGSPKIVLSDAERRWVKHLRCQNPPVSWHQIYQFFCKHPELGLRPMCRTALTERGRELMDNG